MSGYGSVRVRALVSTHAQPQCHTSPALLYRGIYRVSACESRQKDGRCLSRPCMTLKCGRQAQGAGVGRATLRSRSAWSRVRAHTLCLQDEVAVDDLSKAGHVKSVRVEAFKCHDHFEVEFGCAQDQLAVLGERRAHVTEAWLGPCMLVLADFFFFVRSLRVIQRLADGPRAPQSTGGMPCLLHDGSIGCTLIGLFCSSECGYAGHGAQPKCCAPMTFTAGLRLVQAPHHLHQRRERQRQVRDHERTAGAASYLLRQVAN